MICASIYSRKTGFTIRISLFESDCQTPLDASLISSARIVAYPPRGEVLNWPATINTALNAIEYTTEGPSDMFYGGRYRFQPYVTISGIERPGSVAYLDVLDEGQPFAG